MSADKTSGYKTLLDVGQAGKVGGLSCHVWDPVLGLQVPLLTVM